MSQRPPYLSVALISGVALAYEILLMRLFSIIQWHHFSYMIIGLALLGYGFSGTFVSVFQRWLQQRFTLVYLGSLLLFGLTSVTSFMLAQALPFNAELILWDYRQLGYLFTIFLLLSLPFFFAATVICLAFMQFSGDLIDGYLSSVEDTRLQYANWKRAIQPFAHYWPVEEGRGKQESVTRDGREE